MQVSIVLCTFYAARDRLRMISPKLTTKDHSTQWKAPVIRLRSLNSMWTPPSDDRIFVRSTELFGFRRNISGTNQNRTWDMHSFGEIDHTSWVYLGEATMYTTRVSAETLIGFLLSLTSAYKRRSMGIKQDEISKLYKNRKDDEIRIFEMSY